MYIEYSCELHPTECTEICTCIYLVLGIINTILKKFEIKLTDPSKNAFVVVVRSSCGSFVRLAFGAVLILIKHGKRG